MPYSLKKPLSCILKSPVPAIQFHQFKNGETQLTEPNQLTFSTISSYLLKALVSKAEVFHQKNNQSTASLVQKTNKYNNKANKTQRVAVPKNDFVFLFKNTCFGYMKNKIHG